MNDFENLLPNDYGFKPQGKSAPMVKGGGSANLTSSNTNLFADLGPRGGAASSAAQKPQKFDDFGDILGGSARYAGKSGGGSSVDLDSMFGDSGAKHSSVPIFDKPVYDDDIFEGVPGLKSSSSSQHDDFSGKRDGGFDDLLGGFSRVGSRSESSSRKEAENVQKGMPDFDDLIPGFSERSNSQANRPAEPASSAPKTSSGEMENPFSVFESSSPALNLSSGLFTDPLQEFNKFSKSGSTKFDVSSASSKEMRDGSYPVDDLGKSVPTFTSEANYAGKDKSPPRTERSRSESQAYARKEPMEKHSVKSPDSYLKKDIYVDSDLESHQTAFEMPSVSRDSFKSAGQTSSPFSSGATSNEANIQLDMSPRSEETESSDDIWLTVSEIPLFTKPTNAPPPSRPPPPIPLKKKSSHFVSSSKSTPPFQSPRLATSASRTSRPSSVDGLEEFATGGSWNTVSEYANGFLADEARMTSDAAASAAAMKEAMDRAQAKFRHAREVRERENVKAARNRGTMQAGKDERGMPDVHDMAFREEQGRLDHEGDEDVREQGRLEKEREERDKEQRRLEKERERAREIEREKARHAVERATREARERAATEARLRAERAAVEKAERAAVQRAQAEARERAAAGAKERAERAAAEVREREKERAAAESREREREKAEARRRAERMAVERAAAEARERAAAEARERAAAAAKANQQNNDNDLESFFGMGRASGAPRSRTTSLNPFDTQFQNRQGPEPAKTSTGSSTNIRKASSAMNIVDDLSSIFGAAPSSGEFQDIEGESEERRRARLERHQRTQERAAKALAEKNERDLQAQREQAERHRIAEALDVEIKRWAAGKEGNLRALLSTLQYVLWPQCGWQPVSLTDLITAAAVKKAYRKATLCIHPDKVQQKGANLQQKYIAEKVFDLLKEAWNKFNSEELF